MLSSGQFYQQIPELFNEFGGEVVGEIFIATEYYWDCKPKYKNIRTTPQIYYTRSFPQTIVEKNNAIKLKWEDAQAYIIVTKQGKFSYINTTWAHLGKVNEYNSIS